MKSESKERVSPEVINSLFRLTKSPKKPAGRIYTLADLEKVPTPAPAPAPEPAPVRVQMQPTLIPPTYYSYYYPPTTFGPMTAQDFMTNPPTYNP